MVFPVKGFGNHLIISITPYRQFTAKYLIPTHAATS